MDKRFPDTFQAANCDLSLINRQARCSARLWQLLPPVRMK